MALNDIITLVLLIAWLGLALTAFFRTRPLSWGMLGLQLGLIVLTVWLLSAYFGFLDSIQTKSGDDLTPVQYGLAFLCVVAGLVFQTFYIQIKEAPDASQADTQPAIQKFPIWRQIFIAPLIFLVFIYAQGMHTSPVGKVITFYLVAYQTGFFGPIFYEQIKKSIVLHIKQTATDSENE